MEARPGSSDAFKGVKKARVQDVRGVTWLPCGCGISHSRPFVYGMDYWGGPLHSKLSLYDFSRVNYLRIFFPGSSNSYEKRGPSHCGGCCWMCLGRFSSEGLG